MTGTEVTKFTCNESMQNIIGIAGFILQVIQYAAPVVLILWGSIDLIKAITAGKEDEIKKKQSTLIKRAIAAVILFFVPMLVGLVLGLIGATEWKTCWNENWKEGFKKITQDL